MITLDRVGFTAGKRQILKSVSLDIKKGERTLLIGENGCGKTTLLRLIAGLNRPSSGKITYSKIKFNRKNRYKKIGVVYQNPDYMLFMPTVRQEIAYNAVSTDYAEELIELFGLSKIAERHPQSLSEGQKRRVSIAAVLASDPEILLLDEPTVGQDYDGLKEMVEILNGIHEKSGNTMITVTHDVRCAGALCDKAAIIRNGIVAETGGREIAIKFFAGQNI
ncbi:MAG: ABC transporter ATP-binding protein [Clostridia bacterium]|nr:ABC transporter ATP-binding protein [Clostridia bacterium]